MKAASGFPFRMPTGFLARAVRRFPAVLGLALCGCLVGGERDARGSVIENEVAGILSGPGGAAAVAARVRLLPADSGSLSGTGALRETLTDSAGRFRFADLPAGVYTVLGQSDTLYALRDSVVVPKPTGTAKDSIKLPADTLRATGAIEVRVTLKPGDDPATVRGEVLGTVFNARATAGGDLSMPGMPSGRLRIRFSSTLPGYKTLQVEVAVVPGTLTRAGVLALPY